MSDRMYSHTPEPRYVEAAQNVIPNGVANGEPIDFEELVNGNVFTKGEAADSAALKTSVEEYTKVSLPTDNPPEDWETDWKRYYEKVGDEYVHLSGDSAPAYSKNTYYCDRSNVVEGAYSVAIGSRNLARGAECFVSGGLSTAGAPESAPGADDAKNDCVAVGYKVKALGSNSVAAGYETIASGEQSVVIGRNTRATNSNTLASGNSTTASGDCASAFGRSTIASGGYSHAEGNGTAATSAYSHSEGHNTTASAQSAHAGGDSTTASGVSSFTHGTNLKAIHDYSSVFGYNNATTGDFQTVVGGWSSKADGTESGVDPSARFAVGGGAWNRVGQVSFQTGYGDPDSTGTDAHYIKIGNTVLTEAALRSLLGLN